MAAPLLPQEVLQFSDSPQFYPEWAAWLDYWYQRMIAATTLQGIQAVRSAAVNDLINQGAADALIGNQPGEPYGFALGVLDGMTNTAAAGIGSYNAGATSSETLFTPSPPIEIPAHYYGTQATPLVPGSGPVTIPVPAPTLPPVLYAARPPAVATPADQQAEQTAALDARSGVGSGQSDPATLSTADARPIATAALTGGESMSSGLLALVLLGLGGFALYRVTAKG